MAETRSSAAPRGTIVLTGAAHGLGRALAHELARQGHDLVLLDVDAKALDDVHRELQRPGACVSLLRCDLADRGAVSAAAADIAAAHGTLAGLVHCAGTSATGELEGADLAAWERLFAVNFWAAVRLTQELLPALRRAPAAVVGFVASSFAWLPAPGKAAYAASKAALARFAESLAAELHGSTVAVVTVYPGPIATGIATRGHCTDPLRAEREHRFLQERGARPEAVARAVARALERRKPRARIGAFVRASDWLARLAPGFLPRLVGRVRRRLPF